MTARRLVGPGRATQAIAAMTLGFTVANLVGVPLGTVVAQLAGWRIVLGSISTIGVVCIVGLIAWLPRDAGEPSDLEAELSGFRRAVGRADATGVPTTACASPRRERAGSGSATARSTASASAPCD